MNLSFLLLMLIMAFFSFIKSSTSDAICTTDCDYQDFDAVVNNLCKCCSYPSPSTFSGYTCQGCYSGYSLFQSLDATVPQKCVAIQQTDPSHYYPSNLYLHSSGVYYECGQGCDSCIQLSSTDYGCAHVIDSSRKLIEHPTISGKNSKYTIYDCDAAYINTAGVYQGYYYDGTQCKKCSSFCFTCSSGTYCKECIYDKIRFASLASYYTSISTDTFTCSILASRTGTATLTYYLRPQGTACTSSPCANTMSDYSTYYDSFYNIMKDLIDNQLIHLKVSISVTIYIFKSSTGGIGQIYLTHSFEDSAQTLLYGRIFERVKATVTIKAAENCQTNFGHSDNTYCYKTSNNERPKIVFKSAYIFFFVTGSFTLQNLELHGADLMVAFDSTHNNAYSSYCDPTLSGTVSTSSCIPTTKNWFYMNPIDYKSGVTPQFYENLVKKPLPKGLFVLQYIRDVSSPIIPALTFDGCVIYNFYQHKHAFSFIYFEEAGHIVIKNSYFYNMFFVNGLISNTPNINFEVDKVLGTNKYDRLMYNIDRGNPYTSKNKGLSCKSSFFGLSSVITDDCHLINITSTYFQNFNPYLYRRPPLNTYTLATDLTSDYNTYNYQSTYGSSSDAIVYNYNNFQEGILLGVSNINGKIHISNNILKQALSSVNHRLDTSHNCAPFQFTHFYNPSPGDENIDIVSTSSYKLNIDKHMRQHLEAEERVISSLMYIRELKNEFVMYNNTFDSIIAETGAILFVEDFDTSSDFPIMIISNKFTNNLAYAFGANIVFKKNSNDLTQVDCVGITFFDNMFMNNVGCSNTYGNVIVSCEPNHPAACPTQSAVFSSLFYDIPGVNSQSTWAASFSSYYKTYQFKVNNLLAVRAQRDTVLEKSYDDFIINKTNYNIEGYDTANSYINPYTGTTFPYNVLIYSNNTCGNNYLLISNCIYIEGSMGILMENNIFKENGVPCEDFFSFPFYQHSGFSIVTGNTMQTGFIENIYLNMMKEASPIVIRIANYIHINNCLFQNNFAIFLGDFYIGAAITFEKIIGRKNITIENSVFKSHYGYSRFFIQSSSTYYYDYCSFPLISINYWININNFDALNQYTLNRKIDLHAVLISNCNFTTNTFHLTPYMPDPTSLLKPNLTKTNLYAKITYVKTSPPSSFQYKLTNTPLTTYVQIQNSKGYQSKYQALTNPFSYPEVYSFIIHNFMDYEVDSSSSQLAFNLNDKNLYPVFTEILLSFSNSLFYNNINVAGLAFIYTYGFNFTFANNVYSLNTVIEAPTLFQLSSTSTSLAHIIHTSSSYYSAVNSTINFINNYIKNNVGLMMLLSDSIGALPYININGLYIDSHYINKSSIIYISDLSYAIVNNITMVNSISKTGGLYIDTVINSVFSNLNFSQCKTTQSACFYANNLRNFTFNNISCYLMNVISPYYLTITIDVSLLTSTQPPSSIIFDNSLEIYLNNVTLHDLALTHNGIFTVNTQLVMQNYTVLNCYSQYDWPNAMYLTTDSIITIIGGSFYNITCGICQGSLFIVKQQLNISFCSFMNVTSYAGLIYSEDSILYIDNSQFINNTAFSQDSTILGKGGALYISTSNFINNTCTGENTLSFLSSIVYIIDSIFFYNIAYSKTKVLLLSECSYVSISNCTFKDYIQLNPPIISISAGLIYSIESTLSISGSTFDGSIANYGAIYIKGDNTNLMINTSKFINNVASIDAPAIYASCNSFIYNSLFNNNSVLSSSNNAGHIWIETITTLVIQGCNFSNFTINAVYLSNIYNTSVLNSQFLGNNSLFENRGVYFIDCKILVINSSIFDSLVTQSMGAGFYLTTGIDATILLYISNTLFINNVAYNGGGLAITIITSVVLTNYMKNVTFFNNYAQNDGGGFYYNSQNVSSVFELNTCLISQNIAFLAGGGFRFLGMLVTYDNTSHIFNNSAYYGSNIAAYPIHMKQRVLSSPDEYTWYIPYKDSLLSSTRRLLSNVSDYANSSILNESLMQMSNIQPNLSQILNISLVNESIIIQALSQMDQQVSNNPSFNLPTSVPSTLYNDLVTGQNQIPPMIFDLIDYYGQIVATHNTSALTINIYSSKTSSSSITSSNQFTAVNGSYTLYPFYLHSSPGQSISLNLTTDGLTFISGMTYPTNFSFQNQYFFSSHVRNCIRNEYLTDNHECWQCKAGFYNWEFSTCQACDSYTSNCLGGDYVGPQAGYWRLSGNSLNVLSCKTYSSCLGSNVTEITSDYYCKENLWVEPTFCVNGWCGKGYQGIYCYDCIDGWAHSSDSCVPCTNNGSYYAITIVIMLVALIYIIFTIKKALSFKKDEKRKSNKAAILMKILTNYFQLVSIVSSFNFNWSDNTATMMSGQSQVSESSGQIFNFDCVLRSLGTENIGLRSFFLKLSFIAIFPVIAYVICKLVWLVIFYKRHKKDLFKYILQMNNRLMTSMVVIMFIIHPTIVKTSIFSFRCTNLSNTNEPIYYLEKDYEMQCWESTHLKWVLIVALPALIIWGFGLPMLALYTIRKNLEKLNDFEFKKAYGFLYDGYKIERYFWEIVILYRKIIMVFISVFLVTYSLSTQALAVLAVSFLSYILQIKSNPFIDNDLNEAEKKALINSSFTIYAGLYYIAGGLSKGVDILLLVLIVLVNANFGLFWLKTYFLEQIKLLKEAGTWDKILNKLKRKKNRNIVVPQQNPDEEAGDEKKLVIHDIEEKSNKSKNESVCVGIEENNKLMEEPVSRNSGGEAKDSAQNIHGEIEKKDTNDFK